MAKRENSDSYQEEIKQAFEQLAQLLITERQAVPDQMDDPLSVYINDLQRRIKGKPATFHQHISHGYCVLLNELSPDR